MMGEPTDKRTRDAVLAKLQACLNNLSGAGGHVASIRLEPSTFEIVEERLSEDGHRAFETEASGHVLTEHAYEGHEAPDADEPPGDTSQPIQATIVLDRDLELTRDEGGRIRVAPFQVLDPSLWNLADRRALPPAWPEHEASDPDAWFEELLSGGDDG